ncbi:SIR2 family NAD-dependent protein deacylase [Treponema sp.]|uniref:SIR2 family NAD-dependent protein deacylase n=1 Tax=Treponema sp. TaxID=166 RepID=UPI00388E286E
MGQKILKLKEVIAQADTIVIGAGSGLSTSAGFTYTGERFDKHFADFRARYGFTDMYSGGFYPYKTLEENWAFWSRYIWINRYMDAPKTVYSDLLNLVRDKDYFVLTTNVDHCFQKAGFDKKRLFYTQGDYGLFQCSQACHQKTYDNQEQVQKMVESQGLNPSRAEAGLSGGKMSIPTELVPHCPVCGKPMSMNLRADDTFVQDKGWYKAAERYENFIRTRKLDSDGKVLFLELGVGGNTPGIIKYPFWQMTARNPNATYACINFGEAVVPREIADKSICVNADIGEVLKLVQ